MRPLVEATQRWSSLSGEFAQIPDEVRPRILRAAISDPWVLSQLTLPARPRPSAARTGDQRRLRSPEDTLTCRS